MSYTPSMAYYLTFFYDKKQEVNYEYNEIYICEPFIGRRFDP